ncbi:MAG TPA: hypothetical protein VGM43_22710, partial [Bryobacteraceae bacterium]
MGRTTDLVQGDAAMIFGANTSLRGIPAAAETGSDCYIPQQSFSLVRWFSIVSLAGIIVVCFSVTWFLTQYLTKHMLYRDAEVSRDFLEGILTAEHLRERFVSGQPIPTQQTL